ncbi:MAG: general stress protein CsbD, partial [Acidobacteria bacterium]|nr:general stress protein CsbD [Acidobacteriota bacterium]
RLTDDDVEMIGGAKDRLLGRLQERYGWSREEAERNADEWYRTQHEVEPTHTR